MRLRLLSPIVTVVALLSVGGCVKKSTHESVLADLARAREEQEETEVRLREARDAADAALREWEAKEDSLRAEIRRLEGALERLEERRAEAERRFEEARDEVHRLEVLLNERGSEYRRIEQQLRTLRSVEREIRERNRIYEEVIGRFQSLIDEGRLSVSISRGRLMIQLPQDVLFASGSATLSSEGRQTVAEVGSVLAEIDDRTFQVEGHTDNVPIATERFPSNWELSAGRALSVVHLLVRQGVAPEKLSGAAYGEFQPVADNEDRESRSRNRRIEIVMLPNLDVIAETQISG